MTKHHILALWARVAVLAVLAIAAIIAIELLCLAAFILYNAAPSSSRDFAVMLLMTGAVRCGIVGVFATGAWVLIESMIAAFCAPAEASAFKRGAP